MPPNGAGRFVFLLIQTLPTFWAERILILRIFIFWIFWAPTLGPTMGPAWAQLGPSLGPAWAQAWAQLGPAGCGHLNTFDKRNVDLLALTAWNYASKQ